MDLNPLRELARLHERLTDFGQGLRYAIQSPPHLILVLGMHRSGTSCVTRTLNLLGVSFGRTTVDERAPDDGEIHWESPALIWINNEILRRSGGSWIDPPARLRSSNRDLWRCRRFLWEFAGCSLATFKDPRLVLTYPVWRKVLPQHTVIACLRHPMSVARSLEKRDSLPVDRGLELWRQYNQRLREIGSGPHVWWFDFDRQEVAIRDLVDRMADRFSLERRPEALSHYDAGSHHHREDTVLPPLVAELYSALRERAGTNFMERNG